MLFDGRVMTYIRVATFARVVTFTLLLAVSSTANVLAAEPPKGQNELPCYITAAHLAAQRRALEGQIDALKKQLAAMAARGGDTTRIESVERQIGQLETRQGELEKKSSTTCPSATMDAHKFFWAASLVNSWAFFSRSDERSSLAGLELAVTWLSSANVGAELGLFLGVHPAEHTPEGRETTWVAPFTVGGKAAFVVAPWDFLKLGLYGELSWIQRFEEGGDGVQFGAVGLDLDFHLGPICFGPTVAIPVQTEEPAMTGLWLGGRLGVCGRIGGR